MPQTESDFSDDSSNEERAAHKINKCRHHDEDLQSVGKDTATSDEDGLAIESVQNDEGYLWSNDSEPWYEVISNMVNTHDDLGSETQDANDSSKTGKQTEVHVHIQNKLSDECDFVAFEGRKCSRLRLSTSIPPTLSGPWYFATADYDHELRRVRFTLRISMTNAH